MDNGKIKINDRAQVSLEFAAAFVVLVFLLAATTKIFVWFGNNIVQRHKDYENTRRDAGNGTITNSQINFYNQTAHQLQIFGGS